MPSFARAWRTGSGDCSTSRTIPSFSAAGYLICRLPQSRSCFFSAAGSRASARQRPLSTRWPPDADPCLVRSRCPRDVTGQAFLAGLQKFLRPAVIEVLDDPFTAVQLGDAVLAA